MICACANHSAVKEKTLGLMHLSAAIAGGGGGLTPGTYGGIARNLLIFVANFWPGTGALDRFCTSDARYMGKDPRDC